MSTKNAPVYSDDLQLTQEIIAGEVAKYRRVIDKTASFITTLVAKQVEGADKALEIIEDSYIRAFLFLRNYTGDIPLHAWISRFVFDLITMSIADDDDNQILKVEKKELGKKLISTLPPKEREFFVLFEIMKLPFREWTTFFATTEDKLEKQTAVAREKLDTNPAITTHEILDILNKEEVSIPMYLSTRVMAKIEEDGLAPGIPIKIPVIFLIILFLVGIVYLTTKII